MVLSIGDVFWGFLMLSMVQPWLRQRALEAARLRLIRRIEQQRGSRLILMIHRDYAMSGGTLIALAADEIVMDSHAVLGPVDPQIGEFPAASLVRAVSKKSVDQVDDKTLILADVAGKALEQLRSDVLDLIAGRMPPDRAQTLADKLTQGTWTHDHPFSFRDARQLGLPVSSPMPKEFYDLMSLFPQPAQRQPTVRYIPTPYGPRPDHAGASE